MTDVLLNTYSAFVSSCIRNESNQLHILLSMSKICNKIRILTDSLVTKQRHNDVITHFWLNGSQNTTAYYGY